MAVPIMLDPPPVIVQTAQTCWAAAFESWHEANAGLSGTSPTIGRHQLIEWFESGEGLTYESGRATPNGMMLMAGLGLMSMYPFDATYITIERLGTLLESGYIYLTYFREAGAPAHAVVCYGVDAEHIYLMDPYPGRGLIERPANYFLTMQQGHVVVGLPLGVALSRRVGEAVESLRPPPVAMPRM